MGVGVSVEVGGTGVAVGGVVAVWVGETVWVYVGVSGVSVSVVVSVG